MAGEPISLEERISLLIRIVQPDQKSQKSVNKTLQDSNIYRSFYTYLNLGGRRGNPLPSGKIGEGGGGG